MTKKNNMLEIDDSFILLNSNKKILFKNVDDALDYFTELDDIELEGLELLEFNEGSKGFEIKQIGQSVISNYLFKRIKELSKKSA